MPGISFEKIFRANQWSFITDDNILFTQYTSMNSSEDVTVGVLGIDLDKNKVIFRHTVTPPAGKAWDPWRTKLYLYPDGRIGVTLYHAPGSGGRYYGDGYSVILRGTG